MPFVVSLGIGTWNKNCGNTAQDNPIGPHFSQQFPERRRPCTCKTFEISCPKFFAGVRAADMLDVVAKHVSS